MTVVINGTTGITTPSPVVLEGSTSGTITLAAPAVAGSNTQTLVAATGTLAPLILGTAVTASGTSVDFTGIPSWIKRITVMFSGVSTNGASNILVQIGSGSFTISGYISATQLTTTAANASVSTTTGFGIVNAGAGFVHAGSIAISTIATNAFIANGNFMCNQPGVISSAGQVSLGGTLDRVRITTVNGTDTFDAGTINIIYE